MRLIWPFALLTFACAPDRTLPPFPPGFLFGTAIAGFQAEMGCPTLAPAACEDRRSDWHAFISSQEPSVRALLSGHPPSTGPGHWELYQGDFELAARELSNNAFRFSLEWSRIFPQATDGLEGYAALRAAADAAALARYHAMLAALRERGLKPLVTLNHYTLPLWLHDGVGCHLDLESCTRRGWLDGERAVREISKYAGFAAREFGQEVDLWATLNEPLAVVLPGYLMPGPERVNPPAVRLRFAEARAVWLALIEAHARMYDAVKAEDALDADGDGVASEVGLVYAFTPVAPRDPSKRLDVRAAEDVFYLWNLAFLNAVARGELDRELDGTAERREELSGRLDYLGVNYYTRVTVEGVEEAVFPGFSPRTRFNPFTLSLRERYPRGLYEMVKLANQLGVPALVTENGTADPEDDGTGSDFLVRHLTWLARALRDGANVRGYFYWTLMDNYEWNHGMDLRMGLYGVSNDDPGKARAPRKSAGTYGSIAKARRISPEQLERYPEPE